MYNTSQEVMGHKTAQEVRVRHKTSQEVMGNAQHVTRGNGSGTTRHKR